MESNPQFSSPRVSGTPRRLVGHRIVPFAEQGPQRCMSGTMRLVGVDHRLPLVPRSRHSVDAFGPIVDIQGQRNIRVLARWGKLPFPTSSFLVRFHPTHAEEIYKSPFGSPLVFDSRAERQSRSFLRGQAQSLVFATKDCGRCNVPTFLLDIRPYRRQSWQNELGGGGRRWGPFHKRKTRS